MEQLLAVNLQAAGSMCMLPRGALRNTILINMCLLSDRFLYNNREFLFFSDFFYKSLARMPQIREFVLSVTSSPGAIDACFTNYEVCVQWVGGTFGALIVSCRL